MKTGKIAVTAATVGKMVIVAIIAIGVGISFGLWSSRDTDRSVAMVQVQPAPESNPALAKQAITLTAHVNAQFAK